MAALATLPLKISPSARDREHTLKGWNRLLHATSGSNLTKALGQVVLEDVFHKQRSFCLVN